MNLTRLHRQNALLLLVFIVVHFANHLAAIAGPDSHIGIMELLRTVYRIKIVETILLMLFFIQIGLGVVLFYRRWKPESRWSWIQLLSGAFLAFFLLQHLLAVLNMRWLIPEVDTNFYWAASVGSTWPLSLYFIPYYAIGILALFAHLAAALHFRGVHTAIPRTLLVAGIGLSLLIPAAVGGLLYPIDLPAEHRNYIENLYGL